MKRHAPSRPLATALADGVLHRETSFFDYGCGHGGDLRQVQALGIPAGGWDPAFRPQAPLQAAQVVQLGYVLNVIEGQDERARTLQRAWSLAQKLLIVAVRVDRSLDDAEEIGDGLLTSRGTFQKLFTQAELRQYIETVLGQRPQLATLGVAYVFKDPEWEAHYLGTRAFTRRLEYRTDLIDSFDTDPTALRLVERTRTLGRLPTGLEFDGYDGLLERFGSLQRIQRLVLKQCDPEGWAGTRAERRDDILTWLAMLTLSRLTPPKLSSLSEGVQADVRALFKSYGEAQDESIRFLFSLGKEGAVKEACRTSRIGKLLPEDLYVHRSAEDELPALLRLMRHAGRQVVGEVEYDLLKLSLHGRSLSFLRYERFDEEPHPALISSLRVYLPRADYQIRDYSRSENPPILHRKEAFVGPSWPSRERYRQLTEQEEAAGLLGRSDIGFRNGWNAALESIGAYLEDYTLRFRLPNTGSPGFGG